VLKLVDIKKDYPVDGNQAVHALKGINVEFPSTGFVSILGPSGCGKTTLLNILGGLDRYTEGDLIVDEKSTKDFNDHDWDNYRNKKIGMVFQSYNLIGHMSVLANVEVALTLSGVERSKRKAAAIEALKSVGLENQIHKYPNQLSGGQMQRVALARAIVNNPSVILADEPTGALDSTTSVQIMDILAKIAHDRLVLMVTHNRQLADEYSSRIIEIKDGEIVKDYVNKNQVIKPAEVKQEEKKEEPKEEVKSEDYTMISSDFSSEVKKGLKNKKPKKEKSSMSFFTALSISLQNIRSKKGRTTLTAVAGSFGIIGVALVLSLSNGFSNYISNMQSESLAQFPISVEEYSMEYSSSSTKKEEFPDDHSVIINQPASSSSIHVNNITDDYISYVNNFDEKLYSSINYNYALKTNIITSDTSGNVVTLKTESQSLLESLTSSMTSSSYWYQLPSNDEFVQSKYDLIEGTYPKNENEAILVVDKYNSMSKSILSALGFDTTQASIDVTTILDKNFKIVNNDDYYTQSSDTVTTVTGKFLKNDVKNLSKLLEYIQDAATHLAEGNADALTEDKDKINAYFEDTQETKDIHFYTAPTDAQKKTMLNDDKIGSKIKVVGILRPNKTSVATVLSPGVYCKENLINSAIEANKNSVIAKDYQNHIVLPNASMFGISIPDTYYAFTSDFKKDENPLGKDLTASHDYFSTYLSKRKTLGTDITVSSITIYPKDFSLKKDLLKYLDDYNVDKAATDQVKYSDLAGTVFSSLEALVNMISTVLIAFASISLIVSSIMIGIITYNSVIERTKEIGILRAIGARKKDVSRLFKAEACIIGFISGLFGVVITYILCFPINAIFSHLDMGVDLSNLASLNIIHAVILVALSVVLNFIASLIPARMGAKKDPVVALRSE